MARSNSPEALYKDGHSIQTVKEWRTREHQAGRPSGFDDFLRAHGLCVECGGHGQLVTGVRWRDEHGIERSEEGPIAVLVNQHKLDSQSTWLTDKRRWDCLYKSCGACAGTGKAHVK